MSRLYIRVMTGFYTHRKTVKLRSKVGSDANWIVPRLWAYAAENQPDGDLSNYSSEEIAEILGCSKYATSILQALKDCRFVDENGMIHDWSEHNGYHEKYSHRAKIAAAARWSKTPPTPPKDTERGKWKGERGDKHCLEHAPSILENPPAHFPEIGIPSWEEVKLIADMRSVPEASAKSFFEHHRDNSLWVNQFGRLIDWQNKLKTWSENDRSKPHGKNGLNRNGAPHPHWPPKLEVEAYAKEKDDAAGYWVSWYEFWRKRDFKRGENLIDWKVEFAKSMAARR